MSDRDLIKKMRNAIKENDLEIVKMLLQTDPNLIEEETPFGSFLHEAVIHGSCEIAGYLIKKGIDVNKRNGLGNTSALREAAYTGNIELLKLLFENGAYIDISSSEENPLFAAIPDGHIDVVKFLVERGIRLDVSYNIGEIENCDALEYARQYGRTKIYEYLKEKMKK